MNRILAATLAMAFAAGPVLAADAPAAATRGKMLIAADGARLATISRVSDDGAQIILDGRVVTVPANTISADGGKVKTSLTKPQVLALP